MTLLTSFWTSPRMLLKTVSFYSDIVVLYLYYGECKYEQPNKSGKDGSLLIKTQYHKISIGLVYSPFFI